MRKMRLLAAGLCVLFLFGCQKPVSLENWSEFSEGSLQKPDKPFPLLTETVKLEEIVQAKNTDYLRVAYASQGSITVVGGAEDAFSVIEYDLYSKIINREVTLKSIDYYLGSYYLKGGLHVLCANQEENGLQVTLLDVWDKREVASFVSEKLPFHTQVENAVILTSTEQGGTKNTLYQFENGALQEVGSYTCKVFDDGSVTGDVITALGSFEDTLWVQVSKGKKQPLHEAPIVMEQYRAKRELIDTKSTELQIKLEQVDSVTADSPFLFLFGNRNYVLGGLYAYPKPLEESGALLDLQKKTITTLPEVASGNDLNFAAPWQQGYVYGTPTGIHYINLEAGTQEVLYSGEVFSVVAGDGVIAVQTAPQEVMLLQSNRPTFIGDVDSAVADNLETTLNLSDIQVLHETETHLYYLESSDYAQRPYQRADAIVWEYDKAEKTCVQLATFDYIFLENKLATVDEAGKTMTIVADNVGESKKEIIVPIQ